jgi:hypothetical protein
MLNWKAGTLGLTQRRAIATSLRAASRDVADTRLLLEAGRRNALLLLRRAVGRAVNVVLVSEKATSAHGGSEPNLDEVDEANPLKLELAELRRKSDAAYCNDRPGWNGLLPAPPTPRDVQDLWRRVRGLVDNAMDGFGVVLDEETPAQRRTPLRPEPEPVRGRPEPKPRQVSSTKTRPASNDPHQSTIVGPRFTGPKTTSRSHPPLVPRSHPIEPARRIASVTSVAFWSLMDRWKVGDLEALALLGHGGGLTKKGTRPRFQLVGLQAELFAVLREIDTTLSAASLKPDQWLRTPVQSKPLAGKTPIARITSTQLSGARDVLRLAVQESFRRSID